MPHRPLVLPWARGFAEARLPGVSASFLGLAPAVSSMHAASAAARKGRVRLLALLGVVLVTVGTVRAGAAREYLRHVFGAEDVDLSAICWPHEDLWMVHGPKNPSALAELDKGGISESRDEVIFENVANRYCTIEVRAGRVDPAFSLDQISFRHRQMVLQFILAVLLQRRDLIEELASNPANVELGRQREFPGGDTEQYEVMVATMPVVRFSHPAADRESKSVTYRVPLGKKGFNLRLRRFAGTWKIDTSERVQLPLDIFFR